MLDLKNPSLLADRCLIGGTWTTSDAALDVFNPMNGEIVGRVPDCGRAQAESAIQAAADAFPAWKRSPADERADLLLRWHHLMLQNEDDLAQIMTAEQGKPLAEALAEVRYGASFIRWFGEEARRSYGSIIPSPDARRRIHVTKEPVGVCGIITPWNFPNAMITRKCGPALAAGCTVVVKPSELTPLSGLALGVLAEQAGIPPGVINIVTGMPAQIGDALLESPTVRKISFTGSTRVGAFLMEKSATTIKKLSLELGGNAPFIVFEDADLDMAVEAAIASKFRNGGQTCVCANRILVHEAVYDEFAARLVERVDELVVGSGMDSSVQIGPMINRAAVAKIGDHIADALSKGATQLTRSRRLSDGTNYVAPIVLANANVNMRLASEETFGPVAPLFRFSTEAEAVSIANGTPFGLAAYFFTKNLDRAIRISEALEFGMVGLNTGAISMAIAPFGGVKQSGLGREGGAVGMDEYLEAKAFHIGGLELTDF